MVARVLIGLLLAALLLVLPHPDANGLGTDPLIGAKVSRSANSLSTSAAVSFDQVWFESGGDFWNPAQPDRLTVQVAGCYLVQGQITVLGYGYNANSQPLGGNPPAPNYGIFVMANGIEYVAADNLTDELGRWAQLNHTGTVACFEVGDYLQLFVTPGLLVESNWPGIGNLSPVLFIVLLGTV
jgi:hypothetical protein